MLSLDDYLTVEQACTELDVKDRALRARILRGTIASTTILGRRVIHKNTVAQEKNKIVRRGRRKS